MFLQNLEKSMEKDFQSFFKNNYSRKFILKNLSFYQIGKINSNLLSAIGLTFSFSSFLLPLFIMLFLIKTPIIFFLVFICMAAGLYFHKHGVAYFIYKFFKSDSSLIQKIYKSIFNDYYISDEILNLLKVHLSSDEYKELRFKNQNGITYEALNRFILDKKQYLAIEEEQSNVFLNSAEINKTIEQYEQKNFVKFERYK